MNERRSIGVVDVNGELLYEGDAVIIAGYEYIITYDVGRLTFTFAGYGGEVSRWNFHENDFLKIVKVTTETDDYTDYEVEDLMEYE